MADRLTPEQRRLNMSRVRGKDTTPERTVRRLLHARGLRYRLHRKELPGRPDLVFPRFRTALFVHGCFWHGHDCSLFRLPATRTEFWSSKIGTNRRRDAAALSELAAMGWRSIIVWECAMKGRGRLPENAMARHIVEFLNGDERTGEIAETAAGRGTA